MNIRRWLVVVTWGVLGLGLVWLLAYPAGADRAGMLQPTLAPTLPPSHAQLFLPLIRKEKPRGFVTVCPGGECDYTAIQAAVDAVSEDDTIKVAQGVYTSPAFQVIHVTKAITVTGGYTTTDWANSYPLTQTTVLDAEGVARRRGVYVDGTGVQTITLAGLTIKRGYALESDGGGLYILTGTVVIRDCRILSNTASGSGVGGGVYAQDGTLALSNSTFQGNSSALYVGELVITATLTGNSLQGSAELHGKAATLTGNSLQRSAELHGSSATLTGNAFSGGGARLYCDTATLTDNTFQDCSSTGLEVHGGTATLTDNTFQGNSDGGVAMHYCANAVFISNTFLNNGDYTGSSGGVYIAGGDAMLTGNSFQGNLASRGGGISIGGSTVTLMWNVFEDNLASSDRGESEGGAVYAEWSTVTLNGNTILSNTATGSGGGVAIGQHNTATLNGNLVRGNTAETGGAIYATECSLFLNSNAILSNTATIAGGAIGIGEGTIVNARNDTIADNTSPFEAIHVAGGTLTAHHWTLANNGSHALTTSGGSAILTNTIVASHTVAGFWGADITADHTLFFDNGTPCGGGASCSSSLSGDPQFLDPSAGDYHIGPGSAALDRGVGTVVMLDMDSQPRAHGAPDLGADEYWPPGLPKHVHLPLALKS